MGDKIEKTTLKDLGPNLPIGLDGSRKIAFRPWKLKEEKKIGEIKSRQKKMSVAKFVNSVLSVMCTQLGEHDFESLSEKDKSKLISSMYLGDVLYAYIWLRYESLGEDMTAHISCYACDHRFKYAFKLDTLEVTKLNGEQADSYFEYELKSPIKVQGKEITKFLLGSPKWMTMENVSGGTINDGMAKAKTIRGSIVKTISGKEEAEVAISDTDLDELCKRDFETITKEIDNNNVGPIMVMEAVCPKCSADIYHPISWATEDFLSSS